MASANNTTLTPTYLTDSSGGLWSIVPSPTAGAQVCHNGVVDTTTANVKLLLYFNNIVYHSNSAGNFYAYTNSSWTLVPDPRIKVPTVPTVTLKETADGTMITSAGTIINSNLEKWTLVASSTASVGNQIACNGTIDSTTNNVIKLVYKNGRVYQENSANLWWYKTNSTEAWTASSDPQSTTVTPTVTTPTSPGMPSPPPQAVAAGFTKLVFNDDFTTNAIAPSTSATSGYKWYPDPSGITSTSQYTVNTSAKASGKNASSNGGILTINSSNNNYNADLNTIHTKSIKDPATSGCFQHAYFEAYIQFDSNGKSSNGWPSFWAWNSEGVIAQNLSQKVEIAEVDFLEFFGSTWGSNTYQIATTMHNWLASGNNAQNASKNNAPLATIKDSGWHTYGCLWTKTGNGTGNIKFFIDNVQCSYSNGENANGIPTGTGSPQGQTILEQRHLYICLGTGTGWPMSVDWVRVWQ